MNKNSRKIICSIIIITITFFGIYLYQDGISHDKNVQNKYLIKSNLNSQLFPQTTISGFDDLSIKGYLQSDDGKNISNKKIVFSITSLNFNNKTISKDVSIGSIITDADGCYYFHDWDIGMVSLLENETSSNNLPDNYIIKIKSMFSGENNILASSNISELKYYTLASPIIRPDISAIVFKGSDILDELVMERGKSYTFGLKVWRSEEQKPEIVSLDLKNFPCGMQIEFNDDADLIQNTENTVSMKIDVGENTVPGNYAVFIIGNDQYQLRLLNFSIK